MASQDWRGRPTTEEPQVVASATETAPEAEAEESLDVPEEREQPEPVEDSIPAIPSWRRDAAEEQFTGDESVVAVKDWRDSEVVQITSRRSPRETWEQS